MRIARSKSLPRLWTSCRRPPDPRRAPCEPVSVCNRTGLQHAETEIGKWRAETGAQTRPARVEIPEIADQRLGPTSVTRGNVNGSHKPGNNTSRLRT